MRSFTPDTVPYPPGPDPETLSLRLAKPRRGALENLLLAAELLFVGVYAALILGCVAVAVLLSLSDPGTWEIVGIVACALLLALLVQPLLRRSKPVLPSPAVEMTEQPGVSAFLQRVCEDAGADAPRRVYFTADANASVVLHSSLKNLIHAPAYDLFLGLGLVNAVTLSELQAILAHELSHAAGGPIRVWSRGIEAALDALFARSKLVRGALAAARRQVLRERELQADNLAASVAGSDATIAAIRKVYVAAATLAEAVEALHLAAEEKNYSDDLFYHQHVVADRQKGFEIEDESGGDHPTIREREKNLQAAGVGAPIDDRTPWLLLHDAASLRRTVTAALLRTWSDVPKGAALSEPRLVQKVLDADRFETNFATKFGGVYDDRLLKLDAREIAELATLVRHEPWSSERVRRVHGSLYDDVAKRVTKRAIVARQRLRYLKCVDVTDGREALERVRDYDARLERLDAWFHAFDRRVALVHLQMNPDLAAKYRDALAAQERFAAATLCAEQVTLFSRLVQLGDARTDPELYKEFVAVLRTARAVQAKLDPQHAMEDLPAGPLRREWIELLKKRLQRVCQKTAKRQAEELTELLQRQDEIATHYFATADLMAMVEPAPGIA